MDVEAHSTGTSTSTDTPTKPALADWIPEDALKEIAQERSKPEFDGESIEQYSRRMMEDALPQVTKGLINTAIHSTNDRIRFDAQRYLMERVLGKPGEDTANKGLTSLESLFKNMSEAAEQLTLEAAQATSKAATNTKAESKPDLSAEEILRRLNSEGELNE